MKSELPLPQSNSSGTETPKILAILPALIPSSIILVVEPLMYLVSLGKIELRIRLEHLWLHASDLDWANLVVFCRNTKPEYNNTLDRLLAIQKPYIYELDDNFFELPLDTPDGKYHRAPERIAQLEKYIEHASLVRVYSLQLEASVRKYTSKVKVMKAPVNVFSIPSNPPKRKSQKLKLVFPTSRTIADDLSQIFVKDMIRVINEFSNTIEVHFWGFMPEELKGFPSVKFHRFMPNYQKYMRKMYRHGYDIGLAPMKNDVFHNSKTNNKFREFGASWIAGIYSNSEVYLNCVEDNVTGLLVSNDEGEWYQAIVRLMKNIEMRKSIQKQARTVVEEQYSLDIFSEILLNDISSVLQEFIKKETLKADDQKTKDIENKHKPRKLFLRIFDFIRFVFSKMRRLLNDYGMLLVFRLIIDEIGRYAQYCLLSYRIKLVRIYYIIAHFLDRFRWAE